ncbi:MAG: NAD(+)--dinitrogen-reductase ADP-D-ribosyltransferase [Thiobacillaceae bacterium]
MKEHEPGQDERIARVGTDNDPGFVGVATTRTALPDKLTLPRYARLPINRCSLPAAILGSLSYQRHPVPLALDGVVELHKELFRHLDAEADAPVRAGVFQRHMAAVFSLDQPEEAGYSTTSPLARAKASYLRMLRGWAFDSDGMEGAVLKGWVESRFGLLTRHHGGAIRDFSGDTYRHFLEMRAKGLYGTNALEAQLDLLYTYCQYELGRQRPGESHITLYRGVNRVGEHEILQELEPGRRRVLFNNLSSFTTEPERAGEFGDYIMKVSVPLPKVLFMHRLLPGQLKGEDEFMVIGGVYEAAYSLM